MEGGMGIRANLLDPGAQEFHPAPVPFDFALAPPQIYFTYTPQPLPPPPVYVSPPQAAADAAPTRAVVLSMAPRHVAEAAVRIEMEAFGGVRAVEMAGLASEGIVTVHFYDLRSAQAAVVEIREQHVRQQGRLSQQLGGGGLLQLPPESWTPWGGRGLIAGQAVWAHFGARAVDGPNQGSLAVLNLAPAVPPAALAEVFQAYGAVKEVREGGSKPPHHKVVEFFDTRDAARALAELNGREFFGQRMVIEFSRPAGSQSRSGGYSRKGSYHHHHHHSSTLPPRLAGGGWASGQHGRGGGSSSSTARSAERGGEGVAMLKRSDTSKNARIANVSIGKRNKGSSCSSTAAAVSSKQKQQLQQQSGSGGSSKRGWRNHPKHSGEARFLIKGGGGDTAEESASSCRDSRTTVMIKNIPNKYSQKLLLNMLDNHCIHCNEQIIGDQEEGEPLSAYDFVYLPIDFNNKCNVGYGFVNLTSPEAAVRLHRAFHMQPWEVFNSRKICQVTYARLQGLEALKEHFKNSKFACDNDEYMPVVFDPPRDGSGQLTDPVPIGGRGPAGRPRSGGSSGGNAAELGGASSTTTSTHAPSDNADGGDDDYDGDDDGSGGGGDETGGRLSEAFLHSLSISYGEDQRNRLQD